MTDNKRRVLPKGWAYASLGDITTQKIRQGPPLGDKPVPYIDISSIDRDRKGIVDPQSISPTSAPTRARQWVGSNDVLVSMTRPNLNAVAIVPEALDGAVASTGFDVLRAVGVDPRWVYYRVRTDEFVADLCNAIQGVVYPAVRPTDVRAHELPIPPLPEQRRIVAALESHLSRLDAATAALDRAKRTLARYRASVLHAAVSGRLVPTEAELARAEGRDYEPASVLLARILGERRRRWEEAELAKMTAAGKAPKDDRWKARYVEPVGVDAEGLGELPEGWCWARAEQLCALITKGTTPAADKLQGGSGEVPYIKVYNLTNRGTLNFEHKPTYITTATHLDELARSRVFPGDVLMNIVGPPLGKVSVVPQSQPEWNINQAIAIFRSMPSLNTRYLALCLLTEGVLQWATCRAKATAGQFNLTLEVCRDLPIPIPPKAEQDRIVAEADRLISGMDEDTSIIQVNTARLTRLRQSILRLAFEGRLVPQDPDDEPAAVLLERIRAERVAGGGGSGRRGAG